MDNSDANSVSITNDGVSQPIQVIKVFPLDGKPVAESQFWVAVAQLPNESIKRLFLRDGQQHRLISKQSALNLLSSGNEKDLYTLLKVTTNKGGSAPAVSPNKIERINNHPLFNQVNVIDGQNAANEQLLGLSDTHINNQESLLEQKNSTFSTASTNLIAITELVQRAQLESWGAIKVTGSDFFRKQVWLEAAARGLYVEGYMHTEDDRTALLKRIPQHLHSRIRSEYKPITTQKKVFLKNTPEIKANSSNHQKITSNDYQNKVNILDLSEQELTYLLMRVHQMELNKQNSTDSSVELVQNDNFVAKNSEIVEYPQVGDNIQVDVLPIQSLNIDKNENDINPLSADQLSNELDI